MDANGTGTGDGGRKELEAVKTYPGQRLQSSLIPAKMLAATKLLEQLLQKGRIGRLIAEITAAAQYQLVLHRR